MGSRVDGSGLEWSRVTRLEGVILTAPCRPGLPGHSGFPGHPHLGRLIQPLLVSLAALFTTLA